MLYPLSSQLFDPVVTPKARSLTHSNFSASGILLRSARRLSRSEDRLKSRVIESFVFQYSDRGFAIDDRW